MDLTVRGEWLIARMMGSYLIASQVDRIDVSYPEPQLRPLWRSGDPWMIEPPRSPEMTVSLRYFKVTQPLTPEGEGLALEQSLRESGVPELAALASLVAAHREEYEGLIEAEAVLKALGGT